jgi:hypothetical protein
VLILLIQCAPIDPMATSNAIDIRHNSNTQRRYGFYQFLFQPMLVLNVSHSDTTASHFSLYFRLFRLLRGFMPFILYLQPWRDGLGDTCVLFGVDSLC